MMVSAFGSFFTEDAWEGNGLDSELQDGSLLENPKQSLSTRFTLTTHICLQAPVEDKMMTLKQALQRYYLHMQSDETKQAYTQNVSTHIHTIHTILCTFHIKVISKVSNTFKGHQSVSYQKAEQSSDSGCALTQSSFSSLSLLPCRLSLLQTFAPWVQTARQALSSCCRSELSCHQGQQALLWS